MKEIKLITGGSETIFNKECNTLLKEGWKPQSNLVVHTYSWPKSESLHFMYAQQWIKGNK